MADSFRIGAARETVIDTNVVYAPIHQFGGQAGRRRHARIPARPCIGLSAADRADILSIIREYLVGAETG